MLQCNAAAARMQNSLLCGDISSACTRRDIKPENFLLTDKGEAAQLKLCDFGLSSYWKPGVRLQSIVGSCYYVAPEVGRLGATRHAPKCSFGASLCSLAVWTGAEGA